MSSLKHQGGTNPQVLPNVSFTGNVTLCIQELIFNFYFANFSHNQHELRMLHATNSGLK